MVSIWGVGTTAGTGVTLGAVVGGNGRAEVMGGAGAGDGDVVGVKRGVGITMVGGAAW